MRLVAAFWFWTGFTLISLCKALFILFAKPYLLLATDSEISLLEHKCGYSPNPCRVYNPNIHSAEKSLLALFHPSFLPFIYFGIGKEYALLMKTEVSSMVRPRYIKAGKL